MIDLPKPWTQFKQEDKENYFLGELTWELEIHPKHILSQRDFRILAWIKGYDHFLIEDKQNQDLFYVNLNWNKSGERKPPQFKQFMNTNQALNYLNKIKT